MMKKSKSAPVPTIIPSSTPTSHSTTLNPGPSLSPIPTPKPGVPGFEAVFAVAGLLAVAYLVLGRKP